MLDDMIRFQIEPKLQKNPKIKKNNEILCIEVIKPKVRR